MELATAILAAIGLAACAGLRAFMPLFAAGFAARVFGWQLAGGVDWLASDAALIVFGVATVVELLADKVPLVDNVLDAVQTVAAPVAGGIVAFAPLVDLDAPLLAAVAIMTGVAVAGGVHTAAATTRVKSTALTGGTANPILSLIEDVLAVGGVLAACSSRCSSCWCSSSLCGGSAGCPGGYSGAAMRPQRIPADSSRDDLVGRRPRCILGLRVTLPRGW